jgi:hypothetical protein
MNPNSYVREFSRRTGIVDPVVDQYLEDTSLYETIPSVRQFSKEIGVSDPNVDMVIKNWSTAIWIPKPIFIERKPTWWGIDHALDYEPVAFREQYIGEWIENTISEYWEKGLRRYNKTYRPRKRITLTGITTWEE